MGERNCTWYPFLPVYFYCLYDLAVNIHIKILNKPHGTTSIKFWYTEITCTVFHLIVLSSGTITQPVKWSWCSMLKITLLYTYCFKGLGGVGVGERERVSVCVWRGGNKHTVKSNILSAIWGSQDGNYGDYFLQGCNTMFFYILKTDAVNSYDSMICGYQTTQYKITPQKTVVFNRILIHASDGVG